MLIVRNDPDIEALTDPELRRLVQALACPQAWFLIAQTGDSLDALSSELGFPILANRWTGIEFGYADFTPSFELLQEHAQWFEIVFVISDDGYGIEVFVPKAGSDSTLLAMCRAYAIAQGSAKEPQDL